MDGIRDLIAAVTKRAEIATPVAVRIGGHWTGVVMDVAGEIQMGIASTLGGGPDLHHHGGRMPVRDAGDLLAYDALALARLAYSTSVLEASVGIATINALLDVDERACVELNAEHVIIERGAGKHVAIVGHFPFIPRVREHAAILWVLELNPREGDIAVSNAPEVLPQADVIALTGTALLNHTFDALRQFFNPGAFVVMLGGTTPLCPVLFDYGIDVIAGTVVTDPDAALLAVSQGATFRQIPGKRLLTMARDSGA
jgi:uncharacterized protein